MPSPTTGDRTTTPINSGSPRPRSAGSRPSPCAVLCRPRRREPAARCPDHGPFQPLQVGNLRRRFVFPLLTSFVVLVTGHHYVLDIVAGVALVAITIVLTRWLSRPPVNPS
ncbi:phosphatase PAP2 family protein [Actinosynnema sp. CA-248983]